ncbi:hypothetical protein FQA39_LY02223 [Lamprigera yunnana]|nr:hypothetical protein FQA39_LY02223 [Lamprigera yunnana]
MYLEYRVSNLIGYFLVETNRHGQDFCSKSVYKVTEFPTDEVRSVCDWDYKLEDVGRVSKKVKESVVLKRSSSSYTVWHSHENCDKGDANEWLDIDQTGLGYQILNEDKILTAVPDREVQQNDVDENYDEERPTHAETFSALAITIN